MENFVNLDKNMIVNATIGDVPVTWHDVRKPPFDIYGLYNPTTEEWFHRLPMDVAAASSPAIEKLSQECAGGRVRFATDSAFIAIRVKFRVVGRSSHLPLVSSAGFDLYLELKKRGILVRHFAKPRTEAFVRITIGTPEQMQVFLAAVKDILKGESL